MLYRYVKDNEHIRLVEYPIEKETPKSWTIIGEDYKQHTIRKEILRKAYAYPTKEQAFKNFKARTKKYISILEDNIESAKHFLREAERIEEGSIQNIPVKQPSPEQY